MCGSSLGGAGYLNFNYINQSIFIVFVAKMNVGAEVRREQLFTWGH
jgi:hypothetical protein